MKLVLATMRHETNTFSPLPTPLAAFGPKSGDRAIALYRDTNNPIAAYIDIAEREGAEYVVPLIGNASPSGAVNQAAFAIHSGLHMARPDVIAAAHSHSLYGKAWSSLGRTLDPITQDSCIFYGDHVLFDDYTGVVNDPEEGKRLAYALGDRSAAILRNHGILTVGASVDAVTWLFVTMERSCQAQLLAEAAGKPILIDDETAALTHSQVAGSFASWFSAQPMFDQILRDQPDLLD